MDRREFLGWIGVGCLGSSLPVAIAACTPGSQSQSESEAETEYVEVANLREFGDNSQILRENSPVGAILLARSPDSPDVIYAVDPTCTHAGCTVDWNVARELFICPCHQSQYAVNGDVVGGPAPSALTRLNVKVEGDSVLVKPLSS